MPGRSDSAGHFVWGAANTIYSCQSFTAFIRIIAFLTIFDHNLNHVNHPLHLEHVTTLNALAPGFILTDLTNKLWSDPTMQAWGKTNTPLRRLGQVEDMLGTAIFLASKASAFMTGQVVYVDGGFSAGINWPIPL